jgi:hypothetical protein
MFTLITNAKRDSVTSLKHLGKEKVAEQFRFEKFRQQPDLNYTTLHM